MTGRWARTSSILYDHDQGLLMEPRNILTRRSNREETGVVVRQNKSDHAALTFPIRLEEIMRD